MIHFNQKLYLLVSFRDPHLFVCKVQKTFTAFIPSNDQILGSFNQPNNARSNPSLVPRDKAAHLFEVAICNRLLFLDACTAHGSCPEHRTIPALALLEKNCRFVKSILLMFITNVLIADHCENASFYVGSLLFSRTSDERFLKGSQYTILPLYMPLKYRRLNMGIFLH